MNNDMYLKKPNAPTHFLFMCFLRSDPDSITKSQANSLAAFIKHGNEILSLLNYLVEKHHHTKIGEKTLRILHDIEKGE